MDEFLSFAYALADAAGEIIRPYFGTELAVEWKADESPVSIADQKTEAALRQMIAEKFPEHGIYGEEHGAENISQRHVWVIDPIDGTRAFLEGRQEWGMLIALCEDGFPILGILDQPVTGERWVGARGLQSSFNGREIHARACSSLDNASISTTSRRYFTPPQAKCFVTLADQCGEVIEDGDCYAYGLLARGMRDLVVDAGLKPYDVLALVPILEGAGARITGWGGNPITLHHFGTVIAAGDANLHALALSQLEA